MFKNLMLVLSLTSLTACGSSTTSSSQAATSSTSGMTISSGFNCSKVTGGLLFVYQGVTYSTGDAWVSCEISNSATQSANSIMYRSTQSGSTSFYCPVTLDSEAPNSGGFWSFRAGTSKNVTYSDVGATINNAVVTFASSDCSSF